MKKLLKFEDYTKKDYSVKEEFNFPNIFGEKIPEKYKDVYKSIKNMFKGNVEVKYQGGYKRFPIEPPCDMIFVSGTNEDKHYRMILPNGEERMYSGTAVFEFNLTEDLEDIKSWINKKEYPKTDQLQDFLNNFDEYQGDGAILPTKDAPYTFFDTDF